MCGEDEGAVVVSEHGSGGWRDGVKDRWWCRQGRTALKGIADVSPKLK